MSAALRGGVFAGPDDDLADLRALMTDIGSRSFDARIGHRSLPDGFDRETWRHLEDAGLTRLGSTAESGGGPTEVALILRSLARHAVTVPLAETDLLGCWLAAEAGLPVPPDGPVTLALGDAARSGDRVRVPAVPYAGDAAAVVLALRDGDLLRVAVTEPGALSISPGHNAGGEPRDTVVVDPAVAAFTEVRGRTDELVRRGAWARCMQMVGALDAAVEFSVAHTRDREQFGRPLSAFQAVQHTLATMAGEVERARAAAELAVAAAGCGFHSPQADYAVTVAKVTLGQVVPRVATAAHQLHGAIGATFEHRLWLATMRARSWADEFGDTAHWACRLGRLALAADDPWDVIVDGQPMLA